MLEVSRSAFYEWHQHVPSAARPLADERAGGERMQEHLRRQDAGARMAGLGCIGRCVDEGVHVGRKRVARIMRTKGLIGRCRRRWITTTISDPDGRRGRSPPAHVRARHRSSWTACDVGDITYIRTWEGWLYLATVIDLASPDVGRVGDGRAPARRAGRRRAPHGHREPPARGRARSSTPTAAPNTPRPSSPTCSPSTR